MDFGSTRVIQVTNIAPQATRDQMSTLFSFVGKIEDIRLYPTVRDASVTIQSRCCFIKFSDAACLGISQHLTNTVFIDRAIIIQPVPSGEVPEELEGLQMAQQGINKSGGSESKLPPNVTNTIDGSNIITHDPRLEAAGLPMYPPLPASLGQDKIEEIRRTVCIVGLDSTVSAQACMDFFAEAGEVKYFRYCTRENDPVKYALIEFSDQLSVVPALNMNDRQLGMSRIKVTHALHAISKPQAKSNEAAQKEIEEAMSKVKEAQSLVSAAVDPLMGMLGSKRSRSRSRSRRSHSRSRSYRRSRSRDRGYRRRSRSRSRRRSRSRERRRRSRSRSRDRKRRRSRSKSRERRKRSRERRRSRSRSKRQENTKKEEESSSKEEVKSSDAEVKENGDSASNGQQPVETPKEENGKSTTKRRSRSRSRHRSKSRDRERRRRSRTRSRDRERRRRRSRSRERKRRDRERERERKPKSPERTDKTNKISRDYDQEEKGFEKLEKIEEKVEPEDMEISNSP